MPKYDLLTNDMGLKKLFAKQIYTTNMLLIYFTSSQCIIMYNAIMY